MNPGFRATTLLLFSLAMSSIAGAQAFPTATQPLQISAFGAATATWTGLGGGRNVGITAGVDVGWKPFYRLYPSVEVRGTYPVDSGQIDAQENVLYGFKLARFYGRFHPYVNFLVGRDKITYENGGYPNADGSLLYLDSVSNVFSYGGGLDLSVTDQFSLKIDGQFQQYGVPVNSAGSIYSKPISVGIVYRFDFNHHFRYDSNGQVRGYKAPPEPRAAPVPPPTQAPDNAAPSNPAPDTTPASPSSPQPSASDNATPAKPSPDTPASNSSTPQPQQPQ